VNWLGNVLQKDHQHSTGRFQDLLLLLVIQRQAGKHNWERPIKLGTHLGRGSRQTRVAWECGQCIYID